MPAAMQDTGVAQQLHPTRSALASTSCGVWIAACDPPISCWPQGDDLRADRILRVPVTSHLVFITSDEISRLNESFCQKVEKCCRLSIL